MGRCPNCGMERRFLKADHICHVCGKKGCLYCFRRLFQLSWAYEADWSGEETAYACSDKCWSDFLDQIKPLIDKTLAERIEPDPTVSRVVNGVYVNDILQSAYLAYAQANPKFPFKEVLETASRRKHGPRMIWYYNAVKYKESPYAGLFLSHADKMRNEYAGWGKGTVADYECFKDTDYLGSSVRLFNELREYISSKQEEIRKEALARLRAQKEQELLDKAKYCARVGRNEDAARAYEELAGLYEKWELYDKAKQIRDEARRLLGKGPQVVVDLNKLIQQVKDSGIVAIYRCPRCGGTLKVGKNTSADSVKVCEHCGSEIETMDLASFLRTALS